MEIEQFVANVLVPYPDLNLELCIDPFHTLDLLLNDSSEATLDRLIFLDHAFLGFSDHVETHGYLRRMVVIVFRCLLVATFGK